MADNRGFTLIELIIAMTAGILVLCVTMGIYRHVVQGDVALRLRQNDIFRSMQVTHLLNQIFLYRTGPVYGTDENMAIISDTNLLGYGRELIYLASVKKDKSPFFTLRIVPLAFADTSSDLEAIKALYQDPDKSYTYSCETAIRGFASEFSYQYAGSAAERLSGEEPEYLKILLHEEKNEWAVVRTWQ